MVTYNWKIEEMEWINRVSGLAKVVSTVKGRCEGTEDDHTCHLLFTAEFELPESDSFVAYDSLTESQVVTWAKAALGADKVSEMEATIATLVEEDLQDGTSQKHISELPWST